MVPTLTCGFVRVKTSLAIAPPQFQAAARSQVRACRVKPLGQKTVELLLGLEPRTSSLPRTRSTAELQQPGRGPIKRVRRIELPTACLEGKRSAIELHPQPLKQKSEVRSQNSAVPSLL